MENQNIFKIKMPEGKEGAAALFIFFGGGFVWVRPASEAFKGGTVSMKAKRKEVLFACLPSLSIAEENTDIP